MPASSSILEQIQECIRGTLAGLPDFSESSVIGREQGSIQSRIEESLNKLGMSIVVLRPLPTQAEANVPGPHFPTVAIQIHCVTIPTTNTTGLTAAEAAEAVLIALHQKHYTLTDGQRCLLTAASNAIEPVDGEEGVDFVICNLETSATLRPRNC